MKIVAAVCAFMLFWSNWAGAQTYSTHTYVNTQGDVMPQSVTTVYFITCPYGSTSATVGVEGGAIRYRTDGTPATATVGHPEAAGWDGTFNVTPLSNVSIIAQSGTSTVIELECFK